MFQCIKTGFYAELPNGNFLYGDAFGMPGEDWPIEPVDFPDVYLLLRVRSMSTERPTAIHFHLNTWAHWFDEKNDRIDVGEIGDLATIWQNCSTLIASPGQWTWLGYNGVSPS